MKLKIKSTLDGLMAELQNMKENVPIRGEEWAQESANVMASLYRAHLSNQGRRGGYPPALSPATLHMYEVDGPPDGSGIRDHVEQGVLKNHHQVVGFVGIPQGKPTMIARVQNDGAMIPVTDAMRGYLAAQYGIYLRAETKHIYIPARYSWDESIRQSKIISKVLAKKILQSSKSALT